MTCQEIHDYFGDPQHLAGGPPHDSAEIAEHTVSCTDCSRFVEAQRQLGTALRLTRQRVPQLSASVDAAVLANYRQRTREARGSVTSPPGARLGTLAILRWSAALATVALVAVILLFPGRKSATTITQPAPTPRRAASQLDDRNRRDSSLSPETTRKLTHAAAFPTRRSRPAPSAAIPGGRFPAGFRSLMYCDELSCAEAMQMIRVQLPSATAVFLPSSAQTDGAVFADVLVGADGIARGIRIVD